jgi:hypothetical protein
MLATAKVKSIGLDKLNYFRELRGAVSFGAFNSRQVKSLPPSLEFLRILSAQQYPTDWR